MSDTENKEKLTFENALEELEKIVNKMEKNQLSLDDMMKHFERGKKLSDFCGEKLNEFEKKVELLVKETANGGNWKEFKPAESN